MSSQKSAPPPVRIFTADHSNRKLSEFIEILGSYKWQNSSFRGYADYMLSVALSASLRSLIARSNRKRLVMMCAEAVP